MSDKNDPPSHDHQMIHLCLAGIVAIIAGASIGLLSWAGSVPAPLAVVAGLTAAGATFYALVQLLRLLGDGKS